MEKISELRKLQLYEHSILKDVKRVCEKNGLTFYLNGGTMLGAVRHKGFIPWDDDIDICMPYDDYLRFLEIASSELGDAYFIQNCETEDNFYGAFTKIRKNNTTMMPVNHTKYHIHHGIWIDVFPIISINSGIEAKVKKKVLQLSNYILMQDYIYANKEEFTEKIGGVGMSILNVFYHIPLKARKRLRKCLLNWIIKCKDGDSYTIIWTAITNIYPKAIFEKEPIWLEFEGEQYQVPSDYHDYLTIQYGDYMQLPPVEHRKAHGSLILDFENGESRIL